MGFCLPPSGVWAVVRILGNELECSRTPSLENILDILGNDVKRFAAYFFLQESDYFRYFVVYCIELYIYSHAGSILHCIYYMCYI